LIKTLVYLLLITANILPIAKVLSQDSEWLSLILTEARMHIDQGRLSEAVFVFEEGLNIVNIIEEGNILVQEEFLWEGSHAYFNYASNFSNVKQQMVYAERSFDWWKEYKKWYHMLSEEERKRLGNSHNRIKAASRHLGNSIVLWGNNWQLYNEYGDIEDINYLGVDAINLWKQLLYTCPSMETIQPEQRTLDIMRRSICNKSCTEFWLVYADSLKEWANVEYLRQAVRIRKLEEASRIIKIAQNCQI